MKTDELIALLSHDLEPARPGLVMRWLVLGLAAGMAVSALAMIMVLKPRPDLQLAMRDGHFWIKFCYTLALAVLGFVIVQRQAKGGADSQGPILALVAPVAALTVLAALALAARDANTAKLVMGDSWIVCPWLIMALSLPVFVGLFVALRRLAPTRLTMAGASAGLLAGASAATLYGFHCTEMAAPFILIWYTLGIAAAAGLGALLGRWMLAW